MHNAGAEANVRVSKGGSSSGIGVNKQAIRAAIHVAAVFAMYLSAAMLIPAAVDLYYGNPDWQVFLLSALLVGGTAVAVMLATRGSKPHGNTRFALFLVNLLWMTLALAGAVPFMLSSLNLSLTDAVFESMSGVTATGSSIMRTVEGVPPGILLWRSLLSFMGGLGVIVLGLFLLPFLNIGGVSYFKVESTDISDRPFERFQVFTISLIGVYVTLALVCATAYASAGMPGFHAINHAMTTVATGGFSTHDTSFVRYADNPIILWTGSVFMFIGGLPFSVMILLGVRGRVYALRDPQIRVYAGYTLVFVALVTIYLRATRDLSFFDALTHATFNIVSIITTSGFASDDYIFWGPFAVACIYVATFMGGCSGSTTGGIKAYRFLILYQLMGNGLRRLIYPNMVLPVRYGDRTVDYDMQRAVVLFMSSFFVLWTIITVMLAATGLDFVTALTGALASLTNVGPGLGPVIGPMGNFSSFSDPAKWICSAAMLLGRLEILAVLVVFSPMFWRG